MTIIYICENCCESPCYLIETADAHTPKICPYNDIPKWNKMNIPTSFMDTIEFIFNHEDTIKE